MAVKRNTSTKKPSKTKASKTKTSTKKTSTKKTSKRASPRTGGESKSLSLRLERYQVLLEGPQKLDATTRKQVTRLLKEEGGGSIREATANEEWSMERVDVVDGQDETRYQLYLWPFGSGALLAHGTTEVVASVSHHALAMVVDDPVVRGALAVAWQEGQGRLGLKEDIEFPVPEERTGAVAAARSLAEQIAALPEKAAPNSELWLAARAAIADLRQQLFDEWKPYPKLRPARLTADQRALLERAASSQLARDLHLCGLFALSPHNARALGLAAAGASDVEVQVGGERLPLWCALSDVGSGHLEPGPVRTAFQALPPAAALAAWVEIATGEAYDLLEAHPLSPKEVGIPRTSSNVKHRTRLLGWLADASVHLGEAGRLAAEQLLVDLPDLGRYPQIFIGLSALTRHARQAKTTIDPRHDVLIPRIRDYRPGLKFFADKILKEIIQGLPKARAAALPPPS